MSAAQNKGTKLTSQYTNQATICKPSILEIIGRSLHLRRSGKEWTGLCPFHADKNPSLSVNDERGLFHCFACGVGGDVIEFVKRSEKVSFKEALKLLSLDSYRPAPRPHRAEAELVVQWASATSRKVSDLLLEIGDEIYICSLARKEAPTDKELIAQHEAALTREWAILEDLDDDLNDPALVLQLYNQREAIDRLVESLA